MHRFAELMTFVKLDFSGAWWGGVQIHDGQLDDPVLLTKLSEAIYANAYVKGSPQAISPERSTFDNHRDTSQNDRLHAAATSGGREAHVTLEPATHSQGLDRQDSVVVRYGRLTSTLHG